MNRKPWTADEIEVLERMKAEGADVPEIAAALGRSFYSVKNYQKRELFNEYRKKDRRTSFYVTDERAIQVIAQMRRHGCEIADICERLNCTTDVLLAFTRKHWTQIQELMARKA